MRFGKKVLAIVMVMMFAIIAIGLVSLTDEDVSANAAGDVTSGGSTIGRYNLAGQTMTIEATTTSSVDSIVLESPDTGTLVKSQVEVIILLKFTKDLSGSFDRTTEYTSLAQIIYRGSTYESGNTGLWEFDYFAHEMSLTAAEPTTATVNILDFTMIGDVESVVLTGYDNDLTSSFSAYTNLTDITYTGSVNTHCLWDYSMSTHTFSVHRMSGITNLTPGTFTDETAPFKAMFFHDDVLNVVYEGYTGDCANLFFGFANAKKFEARDITSMGSMYILNGMDSIEELHYYKTTSVASVYTYNTGILKTQLKIFDAPLATAASTPAFSGCVILTTVNLPKMGEVTSNLFKNCTSLTSVNLDSATLINNNAFQGCTGLRNITLPSVTKVSSNAFDGCTNLRTVTFDSAQEIGSSAFLGCTSLETVTFKTSVTIGNSAFSGCGNLSSISEEWITTISYGAFKDCTSLSSTLSFDRLTRITSSSSNYPFNGCTSIRSVSLPRIVNMDPYAFYGCTGLTSVEIGTSLKTVADHAFYKCASLSTVSFTAPSKVETIDTYAFNDCTSLTSILIPNSVKTIGNNAFNGSALTSFHTSYVEEIGEKAFYNTAITELTFGVDPDNGPRLKTIRKEAFRLSRITGDLEFPTTLELIGDYAFYQLNLDSVTFDDTSKATTLDISQYAFASTTSLFSLDLGDRVNSIGQYAFSGCASLTDVTIGNSVTSIGNYAFYNCTSMMSGLDIPSSLTTIGNYAFSGTAVPYIRFNNVETSQLESIGENAFNNCFQLTGSLVLPNSLTTISQYAFNSCSLTSVMLGARVSTIGINAFNGNSITNLVIPNTVSPLVLSNNMFAGCPLENVYVASSVSELKTGSIDFTNSASTTVNIWFNDFSSVTFNSNSIRCKSGMTLNVYADPSSQSAVGSLRDSGYVSNATVVYNEANSTTVNFLISGKTPMYTGIKGVYGSKVVLPYYTSSSGYVGVRYAVVDNGNNLYSVFASDDDYRYGIIARSGMAVPVYPLRDGDSIKMSGSSDTTGYINDTTIVSLVEGGATLDVNPSEQEHVYYGKAITVPDFTSDLISVKSILIVKKYEDDGSYSISVDKAGTTMRIGNYFGKFVLDFEDVMINVTFVKIFDGQTTTVVEPMKLMSPFDEDLLPDSVKALMTEPAGYEYFGWWDAECSDPATGVGGVRATSNTLYNVSDRFYVHFKALEFTLYMNNASGVPDYSKTYTLHGPCTFNVDSNKYLYYTDATETNKLIFDKTFIKGWTVDSYINGDGYRVDDGYVFAPTKNKTTGEITDFRMRVKMSINLYDINLQFYLGDDLIPASETFYINGWVIDTGNEEHAYHTGSVISDVSYAYIENGLNMPVPINNTYAFISMDADSTTIPFENGMYTLILAYIESDDHVTIKYHMGEDLYTIQFIMNDDTDYKPTSGPYGSGDTFFLLDDGSYTKVGYTFGHYSIPGSDIPYESGIPIQLTDEMVAQSQFCVVTVTAIWDAIPYTVSFDLSPYEGTVPSIEVVEGGIVTLPDITGYHGYTPASWFWKKGDVRSTEFTDDPELTPDVISLYADNERKLTIGVNWALGTYTLSVDPATGYLSFEPITATYGEDVTLWTNTYVRQFKTFGGWVVGSVTYEDGATVPLDENMAAAGDANGGKIVFDMKWVDVVYQVQYDLDGGTGDIPVDIGAYIVNTTPFTLAQVDESVTYRYGYSFVGWKYSKEGSVIYTTTSDLFEPILATNANANNVVTFYAVWSQKSYKITYDLGEGRSGLSAPTNVLYGDEITISRPICVGFDFAGWTAEGLTSGAMFYSSSKMFMLWNGTTMVNSELFKDLCNDDGGTVRLTAHWSQASYNISYNTNGGSGTVIGGQLQIKIGEVIELPTVKNPYKNGYTYAGWGVDTVNALPAGTVLTKAMITSTDNTLVLYMIWDANSYMVKYRYTDDYDYSTITARFGDNVYIPILNRPGFSFKGWTITGAGQDAYYSKDGISWYILGSTTVNCSYFKNLSSTNGATVTMGAEWTADEYRLSYNSNGGTGKAPVDSNVYKVGDEVVMKDYKELAGTNGSKTIVGWSLDVAGTSVNITEFTQGLCSVADATNTVNLYAVWVNDMCLVVVDLKGCTPSSIPAGWTSNADGSYEKMVVYGSSTKEALSDWDNVTLTKEGYNFTGWSYADSTVISTVDVVPVFEKVDMNILYIFGGVIAVFAVGAIVITKL